VRIKSVEIIQSQLKKHTKTQKKKKANKAKQSKAKQSKTKQNKTQKSQAKISKAKQAQKISSPCPSVCSISHLDSIFSSQLGVTSPIVCSNGAGFSVKLSRLLFCRLKAMGRISAKKNTDIYIEP
jgi:hypothetical protein